MSCVHRSFVPMKPAAARMDFVTFYLPDVVGRDATAADPRGAAERERS
jgi:hypothetical protein